MTRSTCVPPRPSPPAPADPAPQFTIADNSTASAAPPAHVSPDSAYLAGAASEHTLRVLSSMSVRTLRLKLLKACKVPRAQHAAARLWMVLPGGECVELTDEYAARGFRVIVPDLFNGAYAARALSSPLRSDIRPRFAHVMQARSSPSGPLSRTIP